MKILLACSSGISTSLLVNKMNDASKASGRKDKIWAVGQAELDTNIKECDILLLGPQMKFLHNKIKAKNAGIDVKIINIPAAMYSKIDGKGILELVIKTHEE